MEEIEVLRQRVRATRLAIVAAERCARPPAAEDYDRALIDHIAAVRAYESAKFAVTEADRLLAGVVERHRSD